MKFQVLGLSLGFAISIYAQPADLVVFGATVHTVDEVRPQAHAFAVRQGQFIAVGTLAEVRSHIGSATRVVDLTSKTVVPGFNDAHIHPRPRYPEDALWASVDVSPSRTKSIEDLVAAVKRKAALTPEGQWIVGAGYQETKLGRHPTREDLDTASTKHPIRIRHSSGHQSVVNSYALERAGITAETADPAGGHIVKDAKGVPTGRLQESAARLLQRGAALAQEASAPESATIEGYEACFSAYSSKGITSITIAGGSPTAADLMARALGDTPRLRIYQMFGEGALEEAVQRYQRSNTTRGSIRYGAIKSFHGNSLSGQTCWLYEPYAHRPDYFGVPPARTQDQLNELVLRIHRAGLQACIHSNGDREIDMVLNSFENAQRELPRPDPRHRVEHCSIVTPEIVRRLKQLGVIPIPHSYLWEHGDKHEEYGPARWERMHTARSFIDAGVPCAGHSDSPVSEAHPLLRIQDMVTRKSENGKVYGASQRISAAEALRIWTLGGAYAEFQEQVKGTISVGKFADFVVLGQDLLQVDPEQIKDIPIEMTVVGGRTVYASHTK